MWDALGWSPTMCGGAQPGPISCKVPPWILGHGVGFTKALSLEGVFSTQERRRERLILY